MKTITALLITLSLAACGTEPGYSESNAERGLTMLLEMGTAFGEGYTSRSSHRITCTSIAGITTCD